MVEDVVVQAVSKFANSELQTQGRRDMACNMFQAAESDFNGSSSEKDNAKHACDGGYFGVAI